MQVKTLDGVPYKLNTRRKIRSTASNLHKEAISLLLAEFPSLAISEEIKIKIRKGCKPLYLDLYVRAFNLAIEVHGRQHYEYVPYFHPNGITDFYRQEKNDQDKANWCLLNNINLIILKYNERANWIRTIRSHTGRI